MIKTLGYRVSPDEVADVIHGSGEVLDVAIAAEPDLQRGERIVAYIVLKQGGSEQRLARYCGIELPRYMQPARYELLKALPRTPNGKHDINALTASSISAQDLRR
jgi:acyl-CoA synthetase (AMP-forming)/AMP-acid ligase II